MSGDPVPFDAYAPQPRPWVTLVHDGFFPEALDDARAVYGPIILRFGQLVDASESSQRLFLLLQDESPAWLRRQLMRVFRRLVCPEVPLHAVADRAGRWRVIGEYGRLFRDICDVQTALASRPAPHEALCALLWENHTRMQRVVGLRARFFERFETLFPHLTLAGPDLTGDGIRLRHILPGHSEPERPVDFLVRCGSELLAVGWIRHERGAGLSPDSRADLRDGIARLRDTCVASERHGLRALVVTDGAGLLEPDAWRHYGALEGLWPGRVRVTTLRLLSERVTSDWLGVAPAPARAFRVAA